MTEGTWFQEKCGKYSPAVSGDNKPELVDKGIACTAVFLLKT